MEDINSFTGEYRFLSNYWPSEVEFEGIRFPSVEQAYKAAKILDIAARREIAQYPVNKKELEGQIQKVIDMNTIRPDWSSDVKLLIMENLLIQKFSNPVLREKLLSTGDRKLIEGNTWNDTFFGVCGGVGENHLGKLLMKIRDSYKI